MMQIESQSVKIETLKEKMRRNILTDTGLGGRLELANVLQRLGLGYHFKKEIIDFLGSLSIEKAKRLLKGDLYSTALLFRLMREHGFQVSEEVFNDFRDNTGSFTDRIHDDIGGILGLYEASHLSFEGEETLDEAKKFTTKHLNHLKPHIAPHLKESVAHALDLPLHRRMQRLEARWFIEHYERDETGVDPLLLELAKLEFNDVQRGHQMELKRMAWWWKRERLVEKLSFARDRLMECFFFAMGVVCDPQLGYSREELTKVCTLITTIDDAYDVYGTMDELRIFTQALCRWEPNSNEGLPEYMKICYSSLYNITNDIACGSLCQEGSEALPYLKKSWQDLCTSFLVEAEWQSTGYTSTLQEYLDNGWISASGHVVLLHALVLSRTSVPMKVLEWLKEYPRIIRSSSMIFRLCNDLATSMVELERGDIPTSVQCYMRDYGVSEAKARIGIKDRIDEEWKKMNRECMDNCRFPASFANAALNLARTAHWVYQNGDGIGAPDQEKRNQMKKLFFDPL